MIPWFRIGAIAALLLAVYLAYAHYTGLLDEAKAREAVIASQEMALAIKDEQIVKQAAEKEDLKRGMENAAKAVADTSKALADSRNKLAESQEIFNHDVPELMKEKPKTMQRLMQAATLKLWDEIEKETAE